VIQRRQFAKLGLLLSLGRCSRWEEVVAIHGAGATFPYPLYSKWIDEYQRQHPGVRINYQSIGSGGGVRQIQSGTVDFAATDVPMSHEELRGARAPVVHLPMTIGAVAVGYSTTVPAALRFTPELLSDIFLGNVRRWNDPALVALNPDAKLGDLPISVIYRADGSGTSAIFTEFLAGTNRTFGEVVGAGKSVRWPVGSGAKGNEGVARQIQAIPGAIGYLELAYAAQSGIQYGRVRNRAGQFVRPTVASAVAAAHSVPMPPELHVSLVDAPGPDAYPLSAYTYLLVFRDAPDRKKGEALARFLWWALHEGQRFSTPLGYAPLPAEVRGFVEEALLGLRHDRQPILRAGTPRAISRN